MAAASCQMLWFLHLAAKARVDVTSYEDEPDAEMPDGWITKITLRPGIAVANDASEERIRKLVKQAHRHCNVARSLRSEVLIEPRFQRVNRHFGGL